MVKALANTLGFIMNHPLTKEDRAAALKRFIGWQLRSRLISSGKTHPFVNESKLVLKRGLHGATGNIYVGLLEFEAMSFVLHSLREGDVFIDVGANIGSYTVLASAVKKAETIAIEPVPSTFKWLEENIRINGIGGRVTALNVGAGAGEGYLPFTTSRGCENHVIEDGVPCRDMMRIMVRPIDGLPLKEAPLFIKIDTEGHLDKILEGAKNTLRGKDLKAVLIELGGNEKAHDTLWAYGFKPYDYDPFSRALSLSRAHVKSETIYIRDLEFISDRVRSAEKFTVLNKCV